MWKVVNTLFVKNVSKKLCTFVCCGLILFSFFSEYGNFSNDFETKATKIIVYLIEVILTVNYYLFQVFKLNLQDPTIVQYAKGEFTASFPFHLSISSQIVEF